MKLDIVGVNSEGEGIARPQGEGVVFVKDALSGEVVKARILEAKKHYAFARQVEILTPSKERSLPRCPVYSHCGGCQLQHATYAKQLEIKKEILEDALKRIAGFLPEGGIASCVPSPKAWNYRNKTSLPVTFDRSSLRMGFYKKASHEVVPFSSCPVLETPLDDLVRKAKAFVAQLTKNPRLSSLFPRFIVGRYGTFSKESLLGFVLPVFPDKPLERVLAKLASRTFETEISSNLLKGILLNENPNSGNFIWGPLFHTLLGKPRMLEKLASWSYELDISSFFQINSSQALQVFQYVEKLVSSSSPRTILELYCGVGSLTAFLASHTEKVTAVEEWPPAVRLLKKNLVKNRLKNVTVLAGAAESILKDLEAQCDYETVVLDPPRTGCDPKVLSSIIRMKIPRIVYISCKPATLARDVRLLGDGGYRFLSAQPFDLFPQTAHVETVALLERN